MNAPDYKHLAKTDIPALAKAVEGLEKYYGTRYNKERSNISTVSYDVFDSRYGLEAPTIITFPTGSAYSQSKQKMLVKNQLETWLKGLRKNTMNKTAHERIVNKIASEYEFPDLALLIKSVENTFRLPIKDENKTIWVMQPNNKFPILGFKYSQTLEGKLIITGVEYANSVEMRHMVVDRALQLMKNTSFDF